MKYLANLDAANASIKSDVRNALPADANSTTRNRQVEEDDGMKAVRSVVISITHGKRFSSPSINHYKIPIQEEKRVRGREIWSLKNELQNATQRDGDQSSRVEHTISQRRSRAHS
jgi:hypothetical protein